jgi:uncharacterized protein
MIERLNGLKDDVMRRVIEYYAEEDVLQIAHTQCVANYTYIIARGEGRTERDVVLLEIAAWMHDIGCPSARQKYGNSLPVNQQTEGRSITQEWFEGTDVLTADEREWLADVVGTHHECAEARRLGAEPLYEADVIVNVLEGYYKMEQAGHLYDTVIRSKTGRDMYGCLILKC